MTTALTRIGRDERGIVLPLALIMVAIIVPLVVVLLGMGSLETTVASNHMRGLQAQYVAEAGLEDAFNALRATPNNMYTAPAAPNFATVPGTSGGGTKMAELGTYTARYQAAGLNTVNVVVTSSSALGGSTRQIRATFGNAHVNAHGILTGGNLTVNGDINVNGVCPNVHANGNVSVPGNPTITGNLHASGTYSASGSPTVGGTTGGAKPYQTIPSIDPLDFFTAAKSTKPANQVLDFQSNGKVYDGAGTLLVSLSSGGVYAGFKYSPGTPNKFELDTDTPPTSRTYLFRGDVIMSKNPTSWSTSILATGTIEMSGNPVMTPHLQDTALVAGKDVKINGNPGMSVAGLVAAREQVQVSGTLALTGAIIAQDASATSATVVFDEFSGASTITCVPIRPPLANRLRVLSMGR